MHVLHMWSILASFSYWWNKRHTANVARNKNMHILNHSQFPFLLAKGSCGLSSMQFHYLEWKSRLFQGIPLLIACFIALRHCSFYRQIVIFVLSLFLLFRWGKFRFHVELFNSIFYWWSLTIYVKHGNLDLLSSMYPVGEYDCQAPTNHKLFTTNFSLVF